MIMRTVKEDDYTERAVRDGKSHDIFRATSYREHILVNMTEVRQ